MTGGAVSLAFLEPPMRTLTPPRARAWLRRAYRRWAALAGQGAAPGVPARLRRAAECVDIDTRQMVEACALAFETGCSVRLSHMSDHIEDAADAERRLDTLRAVAELEAGTCEGPWRANAERFDTGMRATVDRSIRAQERRAARLQRDAA